MAYSIHIENFEGPFDLLFHLIDKNEVDIYDIPIHAITKQYIEYMDQMQELDMEVASEFIVMAATLLEIKSKMLLPSKDFDEINSELFDADPRKELVTRLVEYRKYREVSEFFNVLERNHSRKHFKEQEDLTVYFKKKTLEEINFGLQENLLMEAMKRVLSNMTKEDMKRKTFFSSLKKDLYTVEDKINCIKTLLENRNKCLFVDIFSENVVKEDVIASFLAVLELLKQKFIGIKQEKQYCDIILYKITDEMGA